MIRKFLFKTIARQLRKPRGLLARKTGNAMNKSNEILYDLTIQTMQPADGESILEIGFGNGKLFWKIFSAANNLRISGLDYSRDMVAEATNYNRQHVESGHLDLRLGSSDNMPFADSSFDKVFCINVVYFWDKPADHLKEIHRVLKPGGRFLATIRDKDVMNRLPFVKYGFQVYSPEEWIDVLARNNFQFVNKIKSVNEPDINIDGQLLKVYSWCIVARER